MNGKITNPVPLLVSHFHHTISRFPSRSFPSRPGKVFPEVNLAHAWLEEREREVTTELLQHKSRCTFPTTHEFQILSQVTPI